MRSTSKHHQIQTNIERHERIASQYATRHGEIYNEIEQQRLSAAISDAIRCVSHHPTTPASLDFGCGAGNLTRHMVAQGCLVTAADVTPSFVDMTSQLGTAERPVTGAILNGVDLNTFESHTFDLAATYSVLHHIPDYLYAVAELCRVVRPGGVLLIDHEASQSHWDNDSTLAEFRRAVAPKRGPSWYVRRLLSLQWWIKRIRKTLQPRYAEEGDIHVWPDDHIEWDAVRSVLRTNGFSIVADDSYLLYQSDYPLDIYHTYASRCSDMHMILAHKDA